MVPAATLLQGPCGGVEHQKVKRVQGHTQGGPVCNNRQRAESQENGFELLGLRNNFWSQSNLSSRTNKSSVSGLLRLRESSGAGTVLKRYPEYSMPKVPIFRRIQVFSTAGRLTIP